jgi:hypothetical protein
MKIKFHDVVTGEIIERDMNAEELALHKTYAASTKANADAMTAKEAARQAVLDKLGLTADEANALFG